MLILSALGALTLAFFAIFWMSPIGVPALKRMGQGKPSPDLTFGYGPAEVYALLKVYGQAGIAHWRRLLLLDMIFPGVYGAFLAVMLDRWALWAEAGVAWHVIALGCPILSVAADYAENILLLRVISALPAELPAAVRAASACTRTKFAAFIATLLIPLAHGGLSQLGRLI
jgi:hypothetical protein